MLVCHNCGSSNLLSEESGDELKYFCVMCGSDYMRYKDYTNDNTLTEIKTFNVGVKIWKEVNSSEVKYSFIASSDKSIIDEFIRISELGIRNGTIEIAEYWITKDGISEGYDIVTNTKKYRKCF